MAKRTEAAIGRNALRVVQALGQLATAAENLGDVCDDLNVEAAQLDDADLEHELISTWLCSAVRCRTAVQNALYFMQRTDWLRFLPERTVGAGEVIDRVTGRATA